MLKYNLLVAVTFLTFGSAFTQDEDVHVFLADPEPGLIFGATLGYVISDDASANYYNGFGTNSIENIIYHPTHYQRIKDQVVFDFVMGEYATAMKYNGAAFLGGMLGYRFSPDLTIALEIGVTNLKLEDNFTLILDDPGTTITEDDIEIATITGEEKRMDFNLGAFYYFGTDRSLPYVELGFNGNYVDLQANNIFIRDWNSSIKKNTNPPTKQGGFAMGIYAGAGFMYRMNVNNAFQLGFKAAYKAINLVEESEKPTMGLHMLPYLRFVFG